MVKNKSKNNLFIFIPLLAALITGLSTVGTVYLQNYIDKNNRKDLLIENIIQDEKINLVLHTILKYYDADRVLLFQVHGKNNILTSKNSYQKISCTHEVLSIGTSSVIKTYQSLPSSMFNDFVKIVSLRDQVLYIDNVEEENRIKVKSILEETGVKSAYAVGVWSNEGKLIGTIIISYVKNIKTINPVEFSYLHDRSKFISLLLMK